jgi:DeoR/GlpR family transcriptional regulator of sugar metabolism
LGKEHRLAERRQAILTVLEEVGQLSVASLSERFDVSEVTIRQDLQALSEQGLLLRTRGGALSTNSLPELSFDLRLKRRASVKLRPVWSIMVTPSSLMPVPPPRQSSPFSKSCPN